MYKRLDFACQYKRMNWKRVMFTDSKYFYYTYQPTGRQAAVWCKCGDTPTMPTVKKSKKVHVYAGLSAFGVTPLFFVQGTSGDKSLPTSVTSAKYINILEGCMLPAFNRLMQYNVRRAIFQQDGAPVHTSDETQAYLKTRGIEVLTPWPPQSPDLSPIENAWAILQQKVNKLKITSFEDFKI